jgi:hypothetical protein
MIGGFGDSFGDPDEREHPVVNCQIFIAALSSIADKGKTRLSQRSRLASHVPRASRLRLKGSTFISLFVNRFRTARSPSRVRVRRAETARP